MFTASNGARKDATKILIVITDGQKYGDPLDYPAVIPLAENAGIIRYAIGVGLGGVHPPLLPGTVALSNSPFRDGTSVLSLLLSQGGKLSPGLGVQDPFFFFSESCLYPAELFGDRSVQYT